MKANIRLTKSNLYYRLLTILLFFLFLACSHQENMKRESSINTNLTDSVSSWIAKAKDRDLKKEKRLQFLKKAYIKNKSIAEDSIKVKNLSEISLRYSILEDSLHFRKINTETIQLSKSIKDTISLANSYWDLGSFFKKKMVMDSAYLYFQKASKHFLSIKNNKNAGRMLLNMAGIQESVNDNTGGEINCIKAIELLKPLEEYKYLSGTYNTLGIIANNLEESEKSIAFYEEASKYDAKANKGKTRLNVVNNLGIAHTTNKTYAKAIPYFIQVIESKNLINENPSLYATALSNLTRARFKLNQTDSIEENYIKALKIRRKENDIKRISSSHYYLAEYYLSREDTINALKHAISAKEYAKQSTSTDRLLESLQLLATTNPKNAVNYQQQHIRITDSLHISERKIRNKFARIRFETDEFIAENELLQRQKQLWTGIAAGLIMLLIAIYVIVAQRAKNQKLRFTQQQQANNQEVFNLMLAQKQKVEEAKRNEQKRISEELHDGVLGKMLGARMVLTGLNKKNDTDALSEKSKAIVVLKNVEGEVRAISHELNHSAYQKIPNFINSITELLVSLSKNVNIKQDFTFDNTIDWDTLSGDIKINAYRMIQECIHNSIKHANCSKVYVIFEIHKTNFELTVGDDGQGYVLNKEKKGIGLRNIKSRIEKLNGHFTVDTAPNRGTSFFFNIPIPEINKYEEHEMPA